MKDTKIITFDTTQLNRQKLYFQSYPKPKKQFVCLHGKITKICVDSFNRAIPKPFSYS